ncbi:MAG: hypothetical protein EAZ15_01855 [Sphingobacteriales bacterium]|nr:MAG: hypothetical protein EAZ15_01855 [Sphingobacteriales bacterium]
MIQTTIVPKNTTVHINIPHNYVGKKVHALMYIDEEITETANLLLTQNPSDFLETLSTEEPNTQPHNNDKKMPPKVVEISLLVKSLTGVVPNVVNTNDDYYQYLTNKYL